MSRLVTVLVAFVFGVVTLAARPAAAAENRLLLKLTLDGRVGQVVTVFATDAPGAFLAKFGKMIEKDMKPDVVVTVHFRNGMVKTFDAKDGIPLVGGQIARITVEFRGAGPLEVEVSESVP